MMDYFVISRGYKNLAGEISKIFEASKDIKVIPERRKNKNQKYSGSERRKFNKAEKIPTSRPIKYSANEGLTPFTGRI